MEWYFRQPSWNGQGPTQALKSARRQVHIWIKTCKSLNVCAKISNYRMVPPVRPPPSSDKPLPAQYRACPKVLPVGDGSACRQDPKQWEDSARLKYRKFGPSRMGKWASYNIFLNSKDFFIKGDFLESLKDIRIMRCKKVVGDRGWANEAIKLQSPFEPGCWSAMFFLIPRQYMMN